MIIIKFSKNIKKIEKDFLNQHIQNTITVARTTPNKVGSSRAKGSTWRNFLT
jgi:hypothetical protein